MFFNRLAALFVFLGWCMFAVSSEEFISPRGKIRDILTAISSSKTILDNSRARFSGIEEQVRGFCCVDSLEEFMCSVEKNIKRWEGLKIKLEKQEHSKTLDRLRIMFNSNSTSSSILPWFEQDKRKKAKEEERVAVDKSEGHYSKINFVERCKNCA